MKNKFLYDYKFQFIVHASFRYVIDRNSYAPTLFMRFLEENIKLIHIETLMKISLEISDYVKRESTFFRGDTVLESRVRDWRYFDENILKNLIKEKEKTNESIDKTRNQTEKRTTNRPNKRKRKSA